MGTSRRLGLALGWVLFGSALGCASMPPSPTPSASSQAAAALEAPAIDSGLVSILKGQPNPDPTQAARDLAAKLGLTGDVVQDHGTAGVVSGSSSLLVHLDTGIAEYNTPYKYGGADSMGNAPDLETCKAAAQQFLAKLAIAPQDQYTFYQDGATGVGTSTGESYTPERTISYNRLWGGRLIQGPGSQLTVFVGINSRIDGAFLDWVQLSEVKRVTYKSADQAKAELAAVIDKQNGTMRTSEKAADFKVTQTTLGYNAFMNADGSRDIVPAYAFGGTYPDDPAVRTYFVAANDDYPLRDGPAATGATASPPPASLPPHTPSM